ncbi:hypothetical protein QQS21_002148 [Conoideocrella luteorostrata]|uniref:Ankyrin repeat domain-containing protein n=1 Tax=Conoideocrella luteorostrata TaxID=1105319 RepID=A0AAJ0CVS3_9HYPO|nr:hypothetical protein QQS21_002148 [Conoideocrella luteorostrata]
MNNLGAQLPDGAANLRTAHAGNWTSYGFTRSCPERDLAKVESLLKGGADPELQDTRGYTALQLAVQRGKKDVV